MLKDIKEEIKEIFRHDASGHDYWHSVRVYNNALKIADREGGDRFIIAVAALLHDVDDVKLFDTKNYENARNIMNKHGIDEDSQEKIINIIKDTSYRGMDSIKSESIEGKIVQDADRLDAMGAIGIARTFAYGGNKGSCIYDPDIKPKLKMNGKEYMNNISSSINHFYEKLFIIKDLMNTETAKRVAEKRDRFMRGYIELRN